MNETLFQALNSLAGHYSEASRLLKKITTLSLMQKPEVTFDLAQSYFASKKVDQAQKAYETISNANDPEISSIAFLQLGVIYTVKGDSAKALSSFRTSLIIKPDNDFARYNLEVLSKNFTPKNNNSPPKSQPQTKTVEKQTTQNEFELKENEKQKTLLKKLNDYHLSKEKAETILETIKNAEIQYVQQRKRKVSDKKESFSGEWW